MSTQFPFVAIVGMQQAKRSLIYHAIDPRLNGSLLMGHRGCAKSTLARAFAEILCRTDGSPAPFVDVPLGTTEDRLLGSVDAAQLVQENQWSAQRGLLAQAHEGILYIDEVNLLPDHLTDSLLDSAASGVHRVERDGISEQVAAQYMLIGSMNPEEGELRPQLFDRFAHKIHVSDHFSVEERTEIVRLRMEFDDDAPAFVRRFEREIAQLQHRIAVAREQLRNVQISDGLRTQVAERAKALQLEGVRTELAVLRTARCAAVWSDAVTVNEQHLAEAWELCYPQHQPNQHATPPPPQTASEPQTKPQPRWQTATAPRRAQSQSIALQDPQAEHSSPSVEVSAKRRPSQGTPPFSVSSQPHLRIDWRQSLLASRRDGGDCVGWQLRFQHSRRRPQWWILLDTSRSTGASGLLQAAREQLTSLASKHKRVRFSLLAFQQEQPKWLARNTTSHQMVLALQRVQEASGESPLPELLREGRHHWRRRGATHQDRWIFCSDALPTVNSTASLDERQAQLRREFQHVARSDMRCAWWRPAQLRGMWQWFDDLLRGLTIQQRELG
jgi:magnesium chelatase subunit D